MLSAPNCDYQYRALNTMSENDESCELQKLIQIMLENYQQNHDLFSKRSLLRLIYQTRIAPCFGIIPMGTGNDLSRCLGTGVGYPKTKNITDVYINQYQTNKLTEFDRWGVNFYDFDIDSIPNDNDNIMERIESCKLKDRNNHMLNYFSIGYSGKFNYVVRYIEILW